MLKLARFVYLTNFCPAFFVAEAYWVAAGSGSRGRPDGVLMILKPGQAGFSPFTCYQYCRGILCNGSIITTDILAMSPMAILMSFFVAIGFCGSLVASSFPYCQCQTLYIRKRHLSLPAGNLLIAFLLWMLVIATGASVALLMTLIKLPKQAMRRFMNMPAMFSRHFWMFWNITPDLLSLAGITMHHVRRHYHCVGATEAIVTARL